MGGRVDTRRTPNCERIEANSPLMNNRSPGLQIPTSRRGVCEKPRRLQSLWLLGCSHSPRETVCPLIGKITCPYLCFGDLYTARAAGEFASFEIGAVCIFWGSLLLRGLLSRPPCHCADIGLCDYNGKSMRQYEQGKKGVFVLEAAQWQLELKEK